MFLNVLVSQVHIPPGQRESVARPENRDCSRLVFVS